MMVAIAVGVGSTLGLTCRRQPLLVVGSRRSRSNTVAVLAQSMSAVLIQQLVRQHGLLWADGVCRVGADVLRGFLDSVRRDSVRNRRLKASHQSLQSYLHQDSGMYDVQVFREAFDLLGISVAVNDEDAFWASLPGECPSVAPAAAVVVPVPAAVDAAEGALAVAAPHEVADGALVAVQAVEPAGGQAAELLWLQSEPALEVRTCSEA